MGLIAHAGLAASSTAIPSGPAGGDLTGTYPNPIVSKLNGVAFGTLATQSGTFSGTSSGTNTGDQTITLTGGVTGSGTGSFAATVITNANLTGDVTSSGNATTIAAGAVTPAKSSTAANTISAGITIDGGGLVVTTGSKGFIQIEYACTLTNWTLLADQSGSAVIDIKRSTYSGFPTTASIIGAGNSPTLSSVQKNTAAPSGWTSVTLAIGDILEYSVTSASTVTRLNLILTLVKT